METIQIGMLGLGTVGSGVLQMIQHNEDKVVNVTGRKLNVKRVLVNHPERHQDVAGKIDCVTIKMWLLRIRIFWQPMVQNW
mgnify:CR=1 FL=1